MKMKTYSGEYNDEFVAFLPENSPLKNDAINHRSFRCQHHHLNRLSLIQWGDRIVADMFPTGGSKGRATWCVTIYCSNTCRSIHGSGKRIPEIRDRDVM